jgi:hypothetical protein
MLRALTVLVALLVLGSSNTALAEYAFEIPRMVMTVEVRPDASAKITYEITFENQGQTIDVVDIGLPHEEWNPGAMQAWVDGTSVDARFSKSTYVEGAVEVPLGSRAIPRGKMAVFRFVTTMPELVFSDTTNDALASFRITPTWFDGNLVRGLTDMSVVVLLPEGVANDNQVVFHKGEPFSERRVQDGRTLVAWHSRRSATGPWLVGVSFPRAVMTYVVELTTWDLFWAWWKTSAGARWFVFLLQGALVAVSFFRLTRGTGWTLYVSLLGIEAILVAVSPAVHLVVVPILLAVNVWLELRLWRGKKGYLPPVISVEGGGIKRGLTAPEAAVLLERPLPQVVTLVAFGLLKKGLIAQDGSPDATALRTIANLRTAKKKGVLAHAGRVGIVVHEYEHGFLSAFAPVTVDGPELHRAIRALLDHVVSRVAGHDVDATRDYYRKVVERAWTDARASAASSVSDVDRDAVLDHRLEWLCLDDEAFTRFDAILGPGRPYSPPWSRVTLPSGTGGGGGMTSVGGAVDRLAPSFTDVASSISGWAESMSQSVVSTLMPSGEVDLGHVDSGFADALKAMAESSGSGGGGGRSGGGCACACAGCACACACAGGGR